MFRRIWQFLNGQWSLVQYNRVLEQKISQKSNELHELRVRNMELTMANRDLKIMLDLTRDERDKAVSALSPSESFKMEIIED